MLQVPANLLFKLYEGQLKKEYVEGTRDVVNSWSPDSENVFIVSSF